MVELFDGWVIETDSKQYILKRHAGLDKNGEEVFSDYKYYSTLGSTLNSFVNLITKKELKEHEVDIKEAAQIYNNAVQELNKLKDELKQFAAKKGE